MTDTNYEKMRSAIAAKTDPDALRQLMKNCQLNGRDDLYWAAFQRLCEVLGYAAHDPNDPIISRLEMSVCAFEELRDGRRASRTRQMMIRRGAVGAIKQWLTYTKPTEGYIMLVDAGLWHLLGEAIPLDFPERFTAEELTIARHRIEDAKQGRVSEPFLPATKLGVLMLSLLKDRDDQQCRDE